MAVRADRMGVLLVLAGLISLALLAATAQASTITYDIQAYIDHEDELIIRAGTLQWHHFWNAAVGRLNGANEPTIISSALGGVTVMGDVNWVPDWPEPPPAEIRYEAYSSVFSDLSPSLPGTGMAVVLEIVQARGSVFISQQPAPENNYTLVIHFRDYLGGAEWYYIRLHVDYGAAGFLVMPGTVGNSGPVTVTVLGPGFQSGATVTACRSDDPATCASASEVNVISVAELTARFDFRGAPIGSVWDLTVANPDSPSRAAPAALTLAQPQVNVWVGIAGPDRVRAATKPTYQVLYGNAGNVDAGDTLIAMQLPGYVESVAASPSGVYLHPESSAMELWFADRVAAGTVWSNTAAVELPSGLVPGTPFGIQTSIGPATPEIRDAFCPSTHEIIPGVTSPEVGGQCEPPGAVDFTETRVIVEKYPLAPLVEHNIDGTCTLTLRCRTWTTQQTRVCTMVCGIGDAPPPNWEWISKSCEEWTTVRADGDLEERMMTVDCSVACALDPESCGNGGGIDGEIVGAIDPNDKGASRGYGGAGRIGEWTGACPPDSVVDLGYVSVDRPIQYLIRFENLPAATADAEDIFITDELDPDLDWNTLVVGEALIAGQEYHPVVLPNPSSHTVTWIFNDVHLPPNQTPPEGEGSVSFSIRPLAGVPTGSEIRNYATIIFDASPPMCTNEVIHTIDAAAPTSAFDALPSDQRWPLILLSWQGGDDPGGSGLDTYSLYVSEAGAPVHLYQAGLAESTAVFTGGYNRSYDFYVCGRDNTGNLEAMLPTPGLTIGTGEGFSDIPEGFWAFREIYLVALAEICQGYPDGSYGPSVSVTRDQMAVYIARAIAGGDANVPDPGCVTPVFTDLPCEHWARKYIQYAVSQNVVKGYEDGTYQPDLGVDRGQMAVYVARAMVAPAGDAGVPDPVPPATFPDVPDTFWSYKHVEYCVEKGVVQGYDDGLYHPEIVVTRDQMAVYVARAFGLL